MSLATEFQCARCGNCCRGDGYVRVDAAEMDRIAGFLEMPREEFVAQYTREPRIPEHAIECFRWLIDKPDAAECVFLTNEGCRINPVKPGRCGEFPFRWRTPDILDYCEGLRRG